MPRYAAHLLAIALVFGAAPAAASAWVVAEDVTKLSFSLEANRLRYQQSLPSDGAPVNLSRKVRQDSRQLFVEHGLTEKWTLTGKAFDSRLQIDATTYDEWQIATGLRRDTPLLRTRLMPPYFYRTIERLCEDCHLHRDRVASLEVTARFDQQSTRADNTDVGLILSLADKILINHFSLMQQIQYGTGGDKLQQWHKWSYRFEMGFGAQGRVGQQSEAFWDRPSDYANLTHGYYLEWHRPASHMAIILLHGDKRDGSQPYAFDTTRLELRMTF